MKNRISFFAMVKNFNSGELEKYDVMPVLYNRIYNTKGKLSKDFYVFDDKFNKIPVKSWDKLYKFIDDEFRYHYWSKCEYEFIVIDWPYRVEGLNGEDVISKNNGVKIDVYEQLKPNLNIITDLLWNEIKDLVK